MFAKYKYKPRTREPQTSKTYALNVLYESRSKFKSPMTKERLESPTPTGINGSWVEDLYYMYNIYLPVWASLRTCHVPSGMTYGSITRRNSIASSAHLKRIQAQVSFLNVVDFCSTRLFSDIPFFLPRDQFLSPGVADSRRYPTVARDRIPRR